MTRLMNIALFLGVTTCVAAFNVNVNVNVNNNISNIWTHPRLCKSCLYSAAADEDNDEDPMSMPMSTSSRRDLFKKIFSSSIIATTAAATTMATNPNFALAVPDVDVSGTGKVLVLGGTGFVGTEVCKQLKALGVDYIATSRDGRDGTIALDFSDPSLDIASTIENIAKDNTCTAVISTVGAIGTGDDVKTVNAGTGIAAVGAKKAGVTNFVYISVAPEVRDSVKGIKALENYMEGKKFSEYSIKTIFDGGYTLIEPTFIYGGDTFAINPPRVADGYGRLVEGLLSSGPFRAAAGISPGLIGVALEPPVKVSSVAGAAVAGALGLSKPVLDTYDEINKAAGLLL